MKATTCAAARKYSRRGWSPIPVLHRSKRPFNEDWPSLRIAEEAVATHFTENQNVGVLLGEPSGWLVDVDLDCDEAVELAPEFLPPTGAIFGRPSRTRSHWLYTSPGLASRSYPAPNAAGQSEMVVEIRSTGLQTVFPPSTHPTEEAIRFSAGGDGEPAHVERDELRWAVERLACAALLLRNGLSPTDACAAARGNPQALLSRLPEHHQAVVGKWLKSVVDSAPSTSDRRAARVRGVASAELEDAVRRYNEEHPQDWGRAHGTCPACGHHECFGRQGEAPDRWVCYSASHAGPGIRGNGCWHGDALDLAAYAAGLSPVTLLVRDDYLEPSRTRGGAARAPDQPTVAEDTDDGPPIPVRARLPVIQANDRQLRDVVKDGWDAVLCANDPPRLFARQGSLVALRDGVSAPHLEALGQPETVGVLARSADWTRMTKTRVVNTNPPKEVAVDMIAYPDERLPPIEEVVSFPVFSRDARLLDRPGYHREARRWLHLESGFEVPPVPDCPTDADLEAARSLLLDDLLGDFPFVDTADRAHAVAAIVLPFVRPMITSPSPLHLIEAPTPGTGKTLLARAIAQIVTGTHGFEMTVGREESETRKRITSALLRSQPVIVIDNVRTGLKSAALAAALTTSMWSDRILGFSKMVDLPNRALWMATANNPDLSLEIARRCIRIRLDAKQDRPWTGREFRHEHLIGWVEAQRARLVHAVLVLVKAWLAAGRAPGGKLGSFESWAETIGGILTHARIDGFLANASDLYEIADAGTVGWRAFVIAWSDEHGEEWLRTGDLVSLAEREDLLAHVRRDGAVASQRARLGRALTKMRGRTLEGWRIELRRSGRKKVNEYRLSRAVSEQDSA